MRRQIVDVDADLGEQRQQRDDQREIERRQQPARGEQQLLERLPDHASSPLSEAHASCARSLSPGKRRPTAAR